MKLGALSQYRGLRKEIYILFFGRVLGGKLADRWNKKHIIVAGDSVSVVCYLICGLIPLSWGTIVLMLLAGMCQSMEYPAYNALIADLSTTQDRDRAYSLQYLGGNLGLVLSPTLSGLLFQNYLWLSFLISGVAIGCSTVLIAWRIRDIRPEKDTSAASVYQSAQEELSLLEVLRRNRLIVFFLAGQAL